MHLYLFLTFMIFFIFSIFWEDPLVAQMVKDLPTVQETQFQSLGREDPPEKEMVMHSSILAWRIPWTGSQRVGHD